MADHLFSLPRATWRRSIRLTLAGLALGAAFLQSGCANDSFLPPPDNLPPEQERQAPGRPVDL